MNEWLKELYIAAVSGNDAEARRIMEKISFEYDMLCRLNDTKSVACFKAVELCCDEITRLERENKELKKLLNERSLNNGACRIS